LVVFAEKEYKMSNADKLLKRVEYYEKMASAQQPEANDLLNKATLFERLALYSDRKSFLSALAQTPPGGGNVKGAVDVLAQALQRWLDTSAEKQDNLGGLKGFPMSVAQHAGNMIMAAKYPESAYTLDLLKRIKESARELGAVNKNLRDANDNVRHSWVDTIMRPAINVIELADKQITALNEWKQNIPPDTTQDVGSGRLEVPEVTVAGKDSLPVIDRQDQQAVFNFAIQQGQLVPNPEKQKADGSLGPETRKALEGVKNFFAKQNPQNPRMTDQQAITAAKFKGR
jgi:hypothetical protein